MKRSLLCFCLITCLFLLVACSSAPKPNLATKTETEPTIEKVIKDWLRAYNSRDTNAAVSFFTDDGVYEDKAFGQTYHGKKEILDFFNLAHADLPNLKWDLISIFSADNRAVFESVLSATHSHSSFPGVPATGKQILLKAATIVELRDGKIARVADYYNLPSFLEPPTVP